MQTIKAIFTTFTLLVGVAFLIASWYIILILAVVAILYLLARTYYATKDL